MQITNLGERGMFVKTLNQEIKGAKKTSVQFNFPNKGNKVSSHNNPNNPTITSRVKHNNTDNTSSCYIELNFPPALL